MPRFQFSLARLLVATGLLALGFVAFRGAVRHAAVEVLVGLIVFIPALLGLAIGAVVRGRLGAAVGFVAGLVGVIVIPVLFALVSL